MTFADALAFGDLNGDGVDDAVVVLVESSGGSGNFRYLGGWCCTCRVAPGR